MAQRKKPITRVEYERLAEFRHALRLFLRFSENAATAAGITPQQHQALLAIKGFAKKEGITIGELAERLQIFHHSAVGLANRLSREGYAKKARGTEDRREMHLLLTARGNRVLEKLTAAHREQLQQIAPQIRLLLEDFSEH